MSLALYTPVTHTYTQFTASVSTCMPLSPSMLAALAISKVWWVLVTTWPRCYTTHTSSLVTVCTCLCACVCLSEWACVRQTLPENECKNCFLSFFLFFFFLTVQLKGWPAEPLTYCLLQIILTWASLPERVYSNGAHGELRGWFDSGQWKHTNIFSTPCPLKR